jgi:molybdopterin-biosynthesis enzyme MoeA-like protein
MTAANPPASKEVVTAALLVIGGKILSGRTKDQNIGYVAEYPPHSALIDPRALAILHEWVKTTGAEMNESRLRMTCIPPGCGSHPQQGSGALGFWIGNAIVMSGVPSIMQAMLEEDAPKLKVGVRMISETVRADAREGDIGSVRSPRAIPEVVIGSYPFFDLPHGANTNVVLRARDAQKLALVKRAVEDMLERVRRTQSK